MGAFSRNSSLKARLVAYNVADCCASELVTQALLHPNTPETWSGGGSDQRLDAVYVESLRRKAWKIGHFVSPFKEFEQINLAAWWNYQRDRIYVKSTKPRCANLRSSARKRINWKNAHSDQQDDRLSRAVILPSLWWGLQGAERTRCTRGYFFYDLVFGRSSIKRWIVKISIPPLTGASDCERESLEPHEFWPQSATGAGVNCRVCLKSYTIDLSVPFF